MANTWKQCVKIHESCHLRHKVGNRLRSTWSKNVGRVRVVVVHILNPGCIYHKGRVVAVHILNPGCVDHLVNEALY